MYVYVRGDLPETQALRLLLAQRSVARAGCVDLRVIHVAAAAPTSLRVEPSTSPNPFLRGGHRVPQTRRHNDAPLESVVCAATLLAVFEG